MDELDRVLVATDGSERARVAVDLAAALSFRDGTAIEVLDVYEPLLPGSEMPHETLAALERDATAAIEEQLADARGRVASRGRGVETVVRRGRAPSEIVREAEQMRTDLIVLGSRGRGPIASMLLGSVAAEVIDRAPCPVLVARRPQMRRILVADDGSSASALAVKAASSWPIFTGLPARVTSVAPVYAITGAGPIRHEDARESYSQGVQALRGMHELIARDAAKALTQAGVPAEPETRCGDPAGELIDAALEFHADCIVMGSRGQTGLERLVTGSVARNVLTHAPMSVLVVRRERT